MSNFEQLVIDNMKLAYSFAWKFSKGSRGIIDLDELQSLSLLGLTKAAKKYDENVECSFSTYAWRAMENEVNDYYRKNCKLNEVSLNKANQQGEELEEMITDDKDIFEESDRNLETKILYNKINRLSDLHKDILMKTLQGMTRQEIAEDMNMNISNVNNEYYKAINILRRLYGKFNG